MWYCIKQIASRAISIKKEYSIFISVFSKVWRWTWWYRSGWASTCCTSPCWTASSLRGTASCRQGAPCFPRRRGCIAAPQHCRPCIGNRWDIEIFQIICHGTLRHPKKILGSVRLGQIRLVWFFFYGEPSHSKKSLSQKTGWCLENV